MNTSQQSHNSIILRHFMSGKTATSSEIQRLYHVANATTRISELKHKHNIVDERVCVKSNGRKVYFNRYTLLDDKGKPYMPENIIARLDAALHNTWVKRGDL